METSCLIIPVDPKCDHNCSHKEDMEGDRRRREESHVIEAERGVTEKRCQAADFEDGGRGHEPQGMQPEKMVEKARK